MIIHESPPLVLLNAPKSIGGPPVLVLRMACELARIGVQCLVVDLNGGMVTEELRKLGLPCISPKSAGAGDKIDHLLPRNAVLVVFNTDFLPITEMIGERTARLLIWDIFPPLWLEGFLGIDLPILRRVLDRSPWAAALRKRIATEMMDREGVVFMDETGVVNMEMLTTRKWPDTSILPIPVENSAEPRAPRLANGAAVSCFYIGRSDAWKVVPCRRLIEDFSAAENVQWTIVTDSAVRFKATLGLMERETIRFVDGVRGADLDRLLLNEADICFGMGTSCLEGAKLGIPSVLLDFVLHKSEMPRHYGYRWVFQEPDYCLGRDVGRLEQVPGMTGIEVLGELLANADDVGRRCWDAVRDKFAVGTVAKKLLLAAQNSRLSVGDYTRNNLFRIAWLGWKWRQFRTPKAQRGE